MIHVTILRQQDCACCVVCRVQRGSENNRLAVRFGSYFETTGQLDQELVG